MNTLLTLLFGIFVVIGLPIILSICINAEFDRLERNHKARDRYAKTHKNRKWR